MGQKGELLPIEEVGKLLHGKQSDNNEEANEEAEPADASPVPVSLKTQGSYMFRSPLHSCITI